MVAVRPQIEPLYHYYCEYDAFGLMVSFARQGPEPEAEAVKNFLGVKVPVKVYPPVLEQLKGHVEPVPDPGNWYADIAEWSAALRSVAQAKTGIYRIVELGCCTGAGARGGPDRGRGRYHPSGACA